MFVKLIPVIEVDVREPEVAESIASLSPIAPETQLYRISDIPVHTLAILTKAHLQGYANGKWTLDEQCTFFGGYVLSINGKNALFPQCCGELSDVLYWKHIAKYGRVAYYNGHPAPKVTFTFDEVIFDCQEAYEEFRPYTPPKIHVSKPALAAAYDQTLQELTAFARSLEQVQQKLKVPVESIAQLLIYHNADLLDESP